MVLNRKNKIKSQTKPIDMKEMIALEEELLAVKREYGITESPVWWVRIGDRIMRLAERPKVKVSRKRYIRLALSCGWFCGSHRFYTHQPVLGVLYLLFFWTGIPFAMTLIDLMIALPMKEDETGLIEL